MTHVAFHPGLPEVLMLLIIGAIYLVPLSFALRLGREKGYGWFMPLLMCLVLSPLLGLLIMAFATKPRTPRGPAALPDRQ
jgi:hypothetical protein